MDSNPFYRVIGAAVNDAKDIVEDSWDWGALRGTSLVTVTQGQSVVQIPASQSVAYRVTNILNTTSGSYLTPVSLDRINYIYANDANNPVGQTAPSSYGFYPDYWDPTDDANANNGLQQFRLANPSNATVPLHINNVARQPRLTVGLSRLKVPALPVYLLATAIASRERGEIGGVPTGELFAVAKKAMSDAIAVDSARFSEELIWYNLSDMSQSNIGTA
tara:strand:+ start:233 stop:889 length:657 start_codon:yes stop_codon:yes gene_type:complete